VVTALRRAVPAAAAVVVAMPAVITAVPRSERFAGSLQ
jgi:hypothetical protein